MKKTTPIVDYEVERMKNQHHINTNQIDKLTVDYFGGYGISGRSVGFKDETKRKTYGLELAVADLTKRVTELEKVIKIAGLVEELDTTDVVKLPQTGSEILATGSFGDKQYIVNKVN